MPVKINWPVVGSTVLPNVGGVAAAVITRNALTPWYRELKKPRWTPSNCAFGVTWGALYSCIGYASYLVYRDGGGFDGAAKIPLIVYGSNILLNWAWTPCFFGLKRTELALYEIQLVNATALATGYLFFKISPLAGYLIVPYSLWLGLATVLNYVIWRDNRKDSARIKEIKEI
ncbi:translocator protein [Euwallacea fornicatus]|uniref:translocator protein n=1 Tax=Euwallacea fornicatus TaxID=995702 RepID=UPI00338EB0B2